MWYDFIGFNVKALTRHKQFACASLNSLLLGNNSSKSIYQLSSTTTNSKHLHVDNNKMHDCLPFFAKGEIVKGFGRGSKELGIPTANFPLEVVKSLPTALQTGIYYGWANVDNGDVHKMVMSIGWNPFYDNKEKSMETHIMHEYNRDLYGCLLKVCIVGYIRPEKNYTTLDDLIAAINNDIAQAHRLLDSDANAKKLKYSEYFSEALDDDDAMHEKNSHLKNGSCCKKTDS